MNQELYNYALRLVARKLYSEFKLTRKLKDKGYPPSEIDLVLKQLAQKDLLNQNDYTEMQVRKAMRRGLAPRSIQKKLSYEDQIAVDNEKIQEIYSSCGLDGREEVKGLVKKKIKGLLRRHKEPNHIKTHILATLMQKGHCLQESLQIYQECQQEVADLLK